MYAYDKDYLICAQKNLAGMLQYVTYDLNMNLTDFYDLFLKSPECKSFEHGNPRVIAGRSGSELAKDILYRTGAVKKAGPVSDLGNRLSPEYWVGYVLAYYQWFTGLSFGGIDHFAPICRIQDMYFPYHEMDIRQFVDHMEELRSEMPGISNLKKYRQMMGLSQSELSALTDIPLRTLQNLEQGQKDISKLRVDYCLRLSRALQCDIDILIESRNFNRRNRKN